METPPERIHPSQCGPYRRGALRRRQIPAGPGRGAPQGGASDLPESIGGIYQAGGGFAGRQQRGRLGAHAGAPIGRWWRIQLVHRRRRLPSKGPGKE
jgi:hypothetical protein